MQTKRLTIVTFMAVAGFLLMVGALQVGASTTATPPAPPVQPAPLEDVWEATPQEDWPSLRAMTITLLPKLEDVVASTWPSRVDDVFYNRLGGGAIQLPADACSSPVISVTWGLALITTSATLNCQTSVLNIDTPPDVTQPYITITYGTRTRAVRHQDLITLTAAFRSNRQYDLVTFTLGYTRPMWKDNDGKERADYWGHTAMAIDQVSPITTTGEEGWVQWVKPTADYTDTDYSYYTSSVALREPLFGSHLTVTQLYVSTLTPTIDGPTFFTAVLENRGVMTAFRWFPVELYVRPASWPSPASITDHIGGVGTYTNFAFLKPVGSPPDSSVWKIEQLGPGMSITLQTAINFMTELGDLRVYAQPDVWFDGDQWHYDKTFGCNPDGYGDTPESNVLLLPQPVFVPIAYRVDASPPAITKAVPPGQTGTFVPQIRNVGNMTDTYTVTVSSARGWPVSHSPSPQILPGASQPLTIQVTVPAGTPEETVDQTTVTIQSKGDPGRSRTVWLYTVARKLHFYLPIITKRK